MEDPNMHHLTSKLVVYRNIGTDSILFKLADICQHFEEGKYIKDNLAAEILTQINRLLDLATRYGFDINLWHNYLAYLLAMTENPFTLVSEKVGANDGTVNEFVKNDLAIFIQLLNYDFSKMEKELDISCFSIIKNYKAVAKQEHVFNKSVSEKVQELSLMIGKAKDENEMYQMVTDFYKKYGVGELGLNKAFRISLEKDASCIIPITTTGDIILDDLVGYEEQKRLLLQNTEMFVQRRKANNVLLFGDAGTGKSSSIKAILNQYYDQGLRMIEIYKHEFKELPKVIAHIKNRNYRFIIFLDDLSFEDFEIEYKYLKAIIEGGLEIKPENVLIYATSNRRHLIRETWNDRSDMSRDEIRRSDTMQEKLSLAARFGITIGYYKPSRDEYIKIVTTLAKKHPVITLSEEELIAEAYRWEMRHGGVSGRTAQQFVTYLSGTASLTNK